MKLNHSVICIILTIITRELKKGNHTTANITTGNYTKNGEIALTYSESHVRSKICLSAIQSFLFLSMTNVSYRTKQGKAEL